MDEDPIPYHSDAQYPARDQRTRDTSMQQDRHFTGGSRPAQVSTPTNDSGGRDHRLGIHPHDAGATADARFRAANRLIPDLDRAIDHHASLLLAVLHSDALDALVDVTSDAPLSTHDKAAFKELFLEERQKLESELERSTGHDIESWLERYWLPIVPSWEVEAVARWKPYEENDDLNEMGELHVTFAAFIIVGFLFTDHDPDDKLADRRSYTAMRTLAARAIRPARKTRPPLAQTWEMSRQGTGWHHGGN